MDRIHPSASAEAIIAHWSEMFLGVRYERGAQGPVAYDCWSFFRWVQRTAFGRDLPDWATPPSRGAIARAMDPWAAALGWTRVEAPAHGDAVFLSTFRHPTHIGVWVADLPVGHVLHCAEGGPRLHDAVHLRAAAWTVRGFYRFAG